MKYRHETIMPKKHDGSSLIFKNENSARSTDMKILTPLKILINVKRLYSSSNT